MSARNECRSREAPRGLPKSLLSLGGVSRHWGRGSGGRARWPRGLTHAQPARGVQRQALGALTAEGASRVEAASIGTDPGEDLAFVHIWAGREKETVVLGEVGRNGASPRGRGVSGMTRVSGRGISVSTSKDFRTPGIPHGMHLSTCSSEGGVNHRVGQGVTFTGEPRHASKATGTGRIWG